MNRFTFDADDACFPFAFLLDREPERNTLYPIAIFHRINPRIDMEGYTTGIRDLIMAGDLDSKSIHEVLSSGRLVCLENMLET